MPGVQAIPWMGDLASTPGVSAIPAGAIPQGANVPGVQSVPAAVVMPVLPVTPVAPVAPVASTAPMSPSPSPVPPFEFVTDLRSLETMSRDLGGWGTTPSEAELRSMASAAPAIQGVQSVPWMGSLPIIPTETIPSETAMIDAAMPQIPGAAMPYSAMAGMPSFGFFDLTRPLEPSGRDPGGVVRSDGPSAASRFRISRRSRSTCRRSGAISRSSTRGSTGSSSSGSTTRRRRRSRSRSSIASRSSTSTRTRTSIAPRTSSRPARPTPTKRRARPCAAS